jgi:hypothetical protein
MGGRVESIWDWFSAQPSNISDGVNGKIACDPYHLKSATLAWQGVFAKYTANVR